MSQNFHRSTNTLSRLSIYGFVFIVAALGWVVLEINRSSYVTEVNDARTQPVPFSHKHHVSGLGIDCRYCHTSVETSAVAGIPSTKTCMNCHAQIWTNAEMLEPVRASFRENKSLEWTKVHDLPDFAYFNHSIHINKGMGCTTCHGQVDQMPLVWKTQSLQMEWCLECHRMPEKFVRPKSEVFNVKWQPPANQLEVGKQLVKEYKIRSVDLMTSCSTCHR
jgi:hypothetical protein